MEVGLKKRLLTTFGCNINTFYCNHRRIRAIIFLLIVLPIVISAQTRPTVAVLDFDARGISQSEAATLTDRLATELGNTEAVILIERKQLNQIMAEQGLQQSGCVTVECVAQVGQLLGAQFMVSGSINKIGSTFTIEAKMFSVETGVNVKTVSKTHRGQIDELIPMMEAIAWELVGLDKRKMETVAVLDFEGRGISQLEAGTLTDRFTSALGKTEAVLIVARQEMNEILQEQGFQQKEGCTTVECAAEVGALIGVKNIINGSIGKVGGTYTIDAQMIAVATGATAKTVNKTYAGKIDGLIIEIEMMAWDIVGLDPPADLVRRQRLGSPALTNNPKIRTKSGALMRSIIIPGTGQFYSGKKMWGWTWITAEAAMLGMTYLSTVAYSDAEKNFNQYQTLYNQTSDTDLIAEYRQKKAEYHDEMETANNQLYLFAGLAGGLWLLNVVHAYITGPSGEDQSYNINRNLQVAYSPLVNQMQVRWEIALD